MSQAGIVDIEGSHPQIPTMFVTNMGTAIPIANTLEILGTAVAAHSIPVQTTGSGNMVTVQVQYASAAGSSLAANAGIASFSTADFIVDANGFVTLTGTAGATDFQVDAFTPPGTNPVAPNGSGVITVTGGQVAAGTTANVIRTNSLAANSYTIQIQRSQAVAVSTIGDNGVSHFNSTYFSVDANGFVSISGSTIGQTITGNTGPAISPTAGNWNIVGTGSLTSAGSGSTLTFSLTGLNNHAILVGAGTATVTNVGPTATAGQVLQSAGSSADPAFSTATYPSTTTINQVLYSSSANVVGGITASANGVLISSNTNVPSWLANSGTAGFVLTANTGAPPSWQNVSASGAIITITGNSGGAEVPTAGGNFNILGTGSITVAGSANTETVQLTGLTNHALQIGAGTATLTQLGPGTTGQVLQTNTTADPTWSTATYPSTVASGKLLYATSTNVVGVANLSVVVQVFTAAGANTYTITPGLQYAIVEIIAGGGGGGSCGGTGAGQSSGGGGGGGGAYVAKVFSAATIGASQTVTIGAGGAGGASGGANPGVGGSNTTFGALLTAAAGAGGAFGAVSAAFTTSNGGAGGTASGGTVNISGQHGHQGGTATGGVYNTGGAGGDTTLGTGGFTVIGNGAGQGGIVGGGGSAAAGVPGGGNLAGGNGGDGIAIITEFVLA